MKAELGRTPKTPPSLMSKLIRGLGGMVISAIFADIIVFVAAMAALGRPVVAARISFLLASRGRLMEGEVS